MCGAVCVRWGKYGIVKSGNNLFSLLKLVVSQFQGVFIFVLFCFVFLILCDRLVSLLQYSSRC